MKLENGSIINQYKILSAIGAGGMGEVFLAQDTKLNRKVAVKFLSDELSCDADKLNRFIQEAQAASALNHPNIITVYEIGESDGTNFIAVEFIEGQTLRERMKARLTFDETLSIVVQTAEALSAAHQAGIVHRDVKPENIMVRADGYVKVLDFGLAKLTEKNDAEIDKEDATRKLVKTNPGVVMGTVNYMSPQQARGKPVDARSDVFSFGIVLYEMLAGCVPFGGETMTDVLAAIINSEPAPLSSFAPHLPKELQRIVSKTLKKKREQRYNSTKDLLGDLKELRDELLLEAKLDQTAAPNRKETNQRSVPQFSTSSGGGLKDTLLLIDFENTTGETIFDYTLKTALAFALAQSPVLDILPDTKLAQTLRSMKREPNERVNKEMAYEICLRLGLKAYITGTISSFGTVYVLMLEAVNARTGESIGRQLKQINSREEVLNALSRAANGLRQQLGESLSSIEKFDFIGDYATTTSLEALKFYALGQEQVFSGKTLEAIPFYKKALELDPEFARAYVVLGVLYANTNQLKLAEAMFTKAYQLREKTTEDEKLFISYFYYKGVTGEINKAIDILELWRKTYPLRSFSLTNLADILERTGQFEKSIAAAREALQLDSTRVTIYMNLAEPLLHSNRYAEMKEICQTAFENKLDGDLFHNFLYQTAFIENDLVVMAEQLGWFSGRDDEYLALDLQTGTAAFRGQWRRAQDFSRRAIDLAKRREAGEVAAKYAAEQALRIAFWSSGAGLPSSAQDAQIKAVVKTQTNNALKLERNIAVMTRAALALACVGQAVEAGSLAAELETERPKDTLLKELWLPMIRAAILLQSGKAKEAIEELEIAEGMERAAQFYPQYLRGLAFLKLNKPKQAAREFDKILNHRGEAALSSIYPLAQLGKARAMKNKMEYEKFFELWKDADKDMPALVAAKKEYENLD